MPFDRRLGALFVFSAADLAANRRGELSDEQRRLVGATLRGTRRGLRRGRVLITVAVLVAAAAAVAISRSPGGGGGGALPLVIAAAILAIMFIAVRIAQRSWSRTVDAAETATMVTTEGPFTWTTSFGEVWIGTIGAARFGVDRAQVDALEGDHRYRVHFLPWRNDLAWVLSIERVDAGGDDGAGH